MTQINWKNLFSGHHDNNETGMLAFLHGVEVFVVERIKGVGFFFWEYVPEVFQALLTWLRATALHLIRIAIRLVRVGVAITVWMLIVFGFLFLYPGIISGGWALLAVIGSIFGVRRRALKMRASAAQVAKSPAELLEFLAHGK